MEDSETDTVVVEDLTVECSDNDWSLRFSESASECFEDDRATSGLVHKKITENSVETTGCSREYIDRIIAERQQREDECDDQHYVHDWLDKSMEWQEIDIVSNEEKEVETTSELLNTSYSCSTWFMDYDAEDENDHETDPSGSERASTAGLEHENIQVRNICDRDRSGGIEASIWGMESSNESDCDSDHSDDNKPSIWGLESSDEQDHDTDQSDDNTASIWGFSSSGEEGDDSCTESEESETSGDNEEAEPPPLKKRRLKCFPSAFDVMKHHCCVDECLHKLSLKDIEQCQAAMQSLNENQQLNFIMKQISDHTVIKKNGNNLLDNIYNFVVAGKSICRIAWCHAFNVSITRFRSAVQYLRDGYRQHEHGNKGMRRSTVKTTNATGWMKHYFDKNGDFMPHKDQIHLPSTWTKKFVYNKMKSEHMDQGILPKDIISEPHFRTIWRQQFPEYVISKGHDFTVCSTCSQLSEQSRAANTTREYEEVNKLKDEHDKQVRGERAAYHLMRERARGESERFTAIIVDGMDQSKTNVPRMVKDKDLAPLERIHVHLTGVLIHTATAEGKIPLIFTDVKEIPHDSNTTVNIILKTLELYRDKLGRILFLQLDNCFRENKNKFVLSLASLLVELKVFEEVIIHFLPVGHTHEDIDQLFSRISRALKEHMDIYTLDDLIPIIEECFTPHVKVMKATPQYNFKEWIENHMAGRYRNHSKPLWFRFRKYEGITRMHYKMWANDNWEPQETLGADGSTVDEDSKGLVCLKSVPDLKDIPEWVIPSLCKLEVDTLRKHLPYAYGQRMPEEKREWWQRYMDNIESLTEVPPQADTWPLFELSNRIAPLAPIWEASAQLEKIREKIHQPCALVQIGNQGLQKSMEHVSSYEALKVSDLVVVNLEDCEEWDKPFIGHVLELDGAEVTVQWMKGSWKKEWKKLVNGIGRNMKPNVDTIPVNSILYFGFTLNPMGHLRKQDIVNIKKLYSDLQN